MCKAKSLIPSNYMKAIVGMVTPYKSFLMKNINNNVFRSKNMKHDVQLLERKGPLLLLTTLFMWWPFLGRANRG